MIEGLRTITPREAGELIADMMYGSTEDVRAAFEDVNCTVVDDEDGLAPLHYAVAHHPELTAFFLERTAHPNPRERRRGMTPLQFAISSDRYGAAATLLDAGADPTLLDRHGNDALWTATHQATLRGREDAKRDLLVRLTSLGCDPHRRAAPDRPTPVEALRRATRDEMADAVEAALAERERHQGA